MELFERAIVDRGAVRVDARRPLPGVLDFRFTSDRHLYCTIGEHFGTILHLAGSSEWTMHGDTWRSRPGTLDLKIPGEVYNERARRGRAEFQVVLYDDDAVEEARAVLGRPFAMPADNALASGDPRALPIVALHHRLLEDAATEHDVCEALTAHVELTSGKPVERYTWSRAVGRARAMLDARIAETVSLDDLAAHARLDKFRLCRAFRDEVGLPPHAYVTLRRVAKALELLAKGVSQAEVAAQVGLYDQSQLHRHFKRIYGMTPGSFVRSLR